MKWSHDTVYQSLVSRGGRVGKNVKSKLNPYVTLYPQDKNCAILYSPESKLYRLRPFHANPDREEWDPKLLRRLKKSVVSAGRSRNLPDGQNFDFYRVMDWDQFAEAVGLEG